MYKNQRDHYDSMPGLIIQSIPPSPDLERDSTDEFGKRLRQYKRPPTRDEQVLYERSQSQAFRKGHGPILSERDLNQTPELAITRPHSPASSTSSNPPPYTSENWGRRAKSSKDWLASLKHEDPIQRSLSTDSAPADRPSAFPNATSRSLAGAYHRLDGPDHPPSRRIPKDHDRASTLGGSNMDVSTANRRHSRASQRARDLSALSKRIGTLANDLGTAYTQSTEIRAPSSYDQPHRDVSRARINKENRSILIDAPIADSENERDVWPRGYNASRRRHLDAYGSLSTTQTQQCATRSPAEMPVEAERFGKATRADELRRTYRQSSANAPELVVPVADLQATPVHRQLKLESRTPLVTGAWVDTPKIVKENPQEQQPMQEYSEETRRNDQSQVSPDEPRHSSALGDLVRSIRSGSTEGASTKPAFGDDTIASLEDLLEPTATQDEHFSGEATKSQTLDMVTIQTELERLHARGRPLSQTERQREQELTSLEGMNRRMKHVRSSIKDAKTGLKRVEKRVDEAATASAARESSVSLHTSRDTPADGCGGCGRPRSMLRALWREVVELFVTEVRAVGVGNTRRWVLTWLGLLSAALLGWYLLENALCSVYCQPRYANRMHGYGVDITAPNYPHVLPTLIFGPMKWLWKPVLSALVWFAGLLATPLAILFDTRDEVQVASSSRERTTVRALGQESRYLYASPVSAQPAQPVYTMRSPVASGSQFPDSRGSQSQYRPQTGSNGQLSPRSNSDAESADYTHDEMFPDQKSWWYNWFSSRSSTVSENEDERIQGPEQASLGSADAYNGRRLHTERYGDEHQGGHGYQAQEREWETEAESIAIGDDAYA